MARVLDSHSDELRVEERFHRVYHDIMELTVTINDPKVYTKPWLALDKFPVRLQPPDFDIREMICLPSELADFLKQVGNPEGGPTGEAYRSVGGKPLSNNQGSESVFRGGK